MTNQTVITLENGSIVKPPKFSYEIGDYEIVNDTMHLYNENNELEKMFVDSLEIVDRTREYVTNEDNWYITYRVKHYLEGNKNKEISLTERDIQESKFF